MKAGSESFAKTYIISILFVLAVLGWTVLGLRIIYFCEDHEARRNTEERYRELMNKELVAPDLGEQGPSTR
jgi:hypothetical protein